MWLMTASSISSPPTRSDCETTIPPRLMTATSVVPPPMSTIMFPVGSATGRAGPARAGADRGGHRLLDQVRLACAGAQRRLFDRALLDAGHPGGDADDDARVREPVLMHLLDEVTEHLLGDVEVGDHAVLQRPDCRDRPGRAPEHSLRLDADRVHLARALVDRDHAGFREHDAATAHVDERVRRPEVDSHVATAKPVEIAQ